jgi:hypothetical protein
VRSLRSRLSRPILAAGLATLLSLGTAANAAPPRQFPLLLKFSATAPHAHVDVGLIALNFEALSKGGKTKSIVPQPFSGFADPDRPIQDAAVAIELRLSCDATSSGELIDTFFVQRGREGTKGIAVHHNKFSYRGTAFDGRVHEGKIAIDGKFTHRGTVAAGGVRVWGAQMENGFGEPLTNCDTEPGGNSAARGKPFKWRLTGAL